eukprot:7073490-Heterocapsa_arctica.AAC.1
MSGLKLNMAKTVLVPLFPCRLVAFRHKAIHCDHPRWSNVTVAHEGTYTPWLHHRPHWPYQTMEKGHRQ